MWSNKWGYTNEDETVYLLFYIESDNLNSVHIFLYQSHFQVSTRNRSRSLLQNYFNRTSALNKGSLLSFFISLIKIQNNQINKKLFHNRVKREELSWRVFCFPNVCCSPVNRARARVFNSIINGWNIRWYRWLWNRVWHWI